MTSANCVGYATRDVNTGYRLVAPTFIDTGDANGEISLANIKLIGSNGQGGDMIQVLDSEGLNPNSYIWLTMDGMGMEDGWYDLETWDPVGTTPVKAGEGLYLNVQNDMTMTFPAQL